MGESLPERISQEGTYIEKDGKDKKDRKERNMEG